jgi:flavodoxin
MKNLLILVSYHHKNTQKIADVLAKILEAEIKTPQQTSPEDLQQYNLIGFGSGIYFGKHHKELLALINRLPLTVNKKAFIFSTSGNTRSSAKLHSAIKEKLESKGYVIVGEFNCAGFDTFGLLKLVGGVNKGKPNDEDLKHAENFAGKMKSLIQNQNE